MEKKSKNKDSNNHDVDESIQKSFFYDGWTSRRTSDRSRRTRRWEAGRGRGWNVGHKAYSLPMELRIDDNVNIGLRGTTSYDLPVEVWV